jgi:hypothetical protein
MRFSRPQFLYMLSTCHAQALNAAARLFGKANTAWLAALVDNASARRAKPVFRIGLSV